MPHYTDARPIASDPKLFLEDLGYDIDTDSDQPGMWVWTASSDGCDSSYPSANEALEGAWVDAASQTMGVNNWSSAQWGALSFEAQKAAIIETLGEAAPVMPFGHTDPDTQMEWVAVVRRSYPNIGSKEAFRLAAREYVDCNGVLPVKAE